MSDNNSGNNNARRDSDIDLFIITSANRLYLTRFLITLVLTVMRLRRHGKKVIDRLCLSFYVSEDSLEFEQIKVGEKDPYLVYWMANLFPLYDRGGYDEFLAKNSWLKNNLPNHLSKHGSFQRRVEDSSISRIISKSFEKILGGF